MSSRLLPLKPLPAMIISVLYLRRLNPFPTNDYRELMHDCNLKSTSVDYQG